MINRRNLLKTSALLPFIPSLAYAMPVPTGVVGDGQTDDTVALQAWLDAGGGDLPAGYYKTTAPLRITNNTIIRGPGTLHGGFFPGGHDAFVINTQSSGCVQLQDFFIQYNAAAPVNTTAIRRSANANTVSGLMDSFRDLYIVNAYDGIIMDQSVLWKMDGLLIGSCGRDGLIINNSMNQDLGDQSLFNTTFTAITRNAVQYIGGGGLKILNMKLSYAYIGLNLNFISQKDTGDLFLQNSSFEGVSNAAVYMSNANDTANHMWYNVILSNNEWQSKWGAITPLGVIKTPWLQNFVAHGNIWQGDGGMYVLDRIANINILGGSAQATKPGATKVNLGPLVRNGVVGLISGDGLFNPSSSLATGVTTVNPW